MNDNTMALTPEQVERLDRLTEEGFKFYIRRNKVFYVDTEKAHRPQADITWLWKNTTGVGPLEFANSMICLISERYCECCKYYWGFEDITTALPENFPYDQVCFDCFEEIGEDEGDEYARNGVSRSDFY